MTTASIQSSTSLRARAVDPLLGVPKGADTAPFADFLEEFNTQAQQQPQAHAAPPPSKPGDDKPEQAPADQGASCDTPAHDESAESAPQKADRAESTPNDAPKTKEPSSDRQGEQAPGPFDLAQLSVNELRTAVPGVPVHQEPLPPPARPPAPQAQALQASGKMDQPRRAGDAGDQQVQPRDADVRKPLARAQPVESQAQAAEQTTVTPQNQVRTQPQGEPTAPLQVQPQLQQQAQALFPVQAQVQSQLQQQPQVQTPVQLPASTQSQTQGQTPGQTQLQGRVQPELRLSVQSDAPVKAQSPNLNGVQPEGQPQGQQQAQSQSHSQTQSQSQSQGQTQAQVQAHAQGQASANAQPQIAPAEPAAPDKGQAPPIAEAQTTPVPAQQVGQGPRSSQSTEPREPSEPNSDVGAAKAVGDGADGPAPATRPAGSALQPISADRTGRPQPINGGTPQPGSPKDPLQKLSAQAPVLRKAVEQQSMVLQTARGMAAALKEGDGTITLNLQPPRLGQLRVHLTMTGSVVSARIEPTNESARQLLLDSEHSLRAALEARGLSVERIDVEAVRPPPQAIDPTSAPEAHDAKDEGLHSDHPGGENAGPWNGGEQTGSGAEAHSGGAGGQERHDASQPGLGEAAGSAVGSAGLTYILDGGGSYRLRLDATA